MRVISGNPIYRTTLIIVLTSIIVLSFLLFGTSITAQPIKPAATVQNSQTGQVISIAADEKSIIIQSGDLEIITIQVDQNTEYSQTSLTPENLSALLNLIEAFMGQGRLMTDAFSTLASIAQSTRSARFSDIEVGDIIAAEPASDGLAASLLIVKISCIRGTLTSISDNSFTVTTTDGRDVTLEWNTSTRFVLKGLRSIVAGLKINVVYNKATDMAYLAIISSPSTSPPPTVSPVIPIPDTGVTPPDFSPSITAH